MQLCVTGSAYQAHPLRVVVLGLQAAWVLGTAFLQERALVEGKVILLKTRPVDPRDLLRGDYVILNYEISDVRWDRFTPPLTNSLPPGQTVYVALEPQGEYYDVVRASLSPITPNATEIVLAGKSGHRQGSESVHVLYGLERYYVREGTGNPNGKLTVQAAVSNAGQGIIKQVFIDGIPYAEAMRNQN